MKVHSLSSPPPWIVHRGNWKDFRQAFSPLWSYSQGAWVSVSVRICGYTLGHTFGVRVLKMDRPDGRRVLKFDGLSGRGLRIAALRQCL